MDKMSSLVQNGISAGLGLVPNSLIIEGISKGITHIKDKIKDSNTPWDDATLLPIIEKMQEALNVPDYVESADEESEEEG